jgi:hypothetical protein
LYILQAGVFSLEGIDDDLADEDELIDETTSDEDVPLDGEFPLLTGGAGPSGAAEESSTDEEAEGEGEDDEDEGEEGEEDEDEDESEEEVDPSNPFRSDGDSFIRDGRVVLLGEFSDYGGTIELAPDAGVGADDPSPEMEKVIWQWSRRYALCMCWNVFLSQYVRPNVLLLQVY